MPLPLSSVPHFSSFLDSLPSRLFFSERVKTLPPPVHLSLIKHASDQFTLEDLQQLASAHRIHAAPGLPSSCDIVPSWEPKMFTPCLLPSVKRHLNQKAQYCPNVASDVSLPALFLGVNLAKPDPGPFLVEKGPGWGVGCGCAIFPLVTKRGPCLRAVSAALLPSGPLRGGFLRRQG